MPRRWWSPRRRRVSGRGRCANDGGIRVCRILSPAPGAGIIAPAGTPKEIVDRIAAEAKKALADPAMQAKLAEQGDRRPVGNTPDEFRSFVAEEGNRPLGQGDQGRRDQDGASKHRCHPSPKGRG